jgi:uncharacterized membrane protein
MKQDLMSSLKEQGKAIMVMMTIAVLSVLAMIVLGYFINVVRSISSLGTTNATDGIVTLNESVQITLNLFIGAFGITGSFAAVTILIIVIKTVIGVVRNLKS